jgi:hypothetical protein
LINKKNELIHDIENNVKPRRNSVVVTLEKLPQSASLTAPSKREPDHSVALLVRQLSLKGEPCLYTLVNLSRTPAKASPFKGRCHGVSHDGEVASLPEGGGTANAVTVGVLPQRERLL